MKQRESQVEKRIKIALHTNLYEHRKNLPRFLASFAFYSAVGILSGVVVDLLMKQIAGKEKKRWRCALALVSQVLLVGVLFFFLVKITGPEMYFDDWLMSTFVGFIFSLTFFAAQSSLSENINCVFEQ